jgi:tripartite-type tricarboxylate transporter receptor subunit TctC
MKRRTLLRGSAAAALSASLLPSLRAFAQGEAYPTKTLRIVVPFAAGTSPDVLARMFADKLSQSWGQAVVIDNRPGAAGAIGAENAANSPADGHTFFYPVSSVMEINPHVYATLRYNPLTDFLPVIQTAIVPYVLCASPAAPFNTMAEMVEYAKQNPGRVNYASYGVGSQTQVAIEIWCKELGIRLTHIPYVSNAIPDLMSGVVSLLLEPATTAIALVKANKIKALGASSEQRITSLPNVPTLSEYRRGLQTAAWHGLFVPKGTPPTIIAKANAEMARILALPEVRARLTELGLFSAGGSADDLKARLAAGHASWGRAIKELGIKLQ